MSWRRRVVAGGVVLMTHQSQPPMPAMSMAAAATSTPGRVAAGLVRTSSKTVMSRLARRLSQAITSCRSNLHPRLMKKRSGLEQASEF